MKYACFADKGPLPITPLPCAKVAHTWNIDDDMRCARVIYLEKAVDRLNEQLENKEFIKQYTRYNKTFANRLALVIDRLTSNPLPD